MRAGEVVLPVIVAAFSVAAMSGCGSVGSRGQAATSVAENLLTAVDRQDGAGACMLLAPETAAKVAQSEQKDCADAITRENLPKPGTATRSDVYGQWARVVLSDDTIFLAMFGGKWRVVAAGCTARGNRPYDCAIEGG
jgi:uncharacterized protein YceK